MFRESDNIDDRELNSFRVNKKFEKKFMKRKRREELEKGKKKYGRNFENLINEEDMTSGSSLEEDSDAELLNDDIELKFMTTLAKIRTKDPEIYNSEQRFFKEEDFGHEEVLLGKRGEPTRKKITYKDQIRQQALKEMQGEESDEDETQKKLKVETPYELEMRNKRDFKNAANWQDESESDSDDDFLKKKEKTQREILDENEEFNRFLEKKKQENEKEAEELEEVWGENGQLDKNEQFLRNFFLTKAWIDGEDDFGGNRFDHIDQEDEVKDEEVDKFEHKINFRHEEGKDAKNLKFYERDIKGTLRKDDKKTKRAEKRKEVRERKKREKEEKKREIDQLKNIKKSMIQDKIKKLQAVSGLKSQEQFKKLQELMQGKFSAKEYDREMLKIYGEDYFEDPEEDERDLKRYVKEIESKYNNTIKGDKFESTLKKSKYDDKEQVLDKQDEMILNPKPNIPVEIKKKLNNIEAKELAKSLNEPIWWYCDSCFRGIQPKQARYECLECPDYSECKDCSNLKNHDHPMKRFVVPDGCYPPPDDEIYKILEKFVLCNECEVKMDDTFLYYQHKHDDDYFLCEKCMNFNMEEYKKKHKTGNTIKDFIVVRPQRINVSKEIDNDNIHKLKGENPELDRLIDDYMNVDFEDIIAGNIKTRFRYTEVDKNSFMLTDDEMIYCDDKLLNKYLSLKKFAPYKDENQTISSKHWKRMKKMRTLVRNNAERNKEKFNKEISLLREEEVLRNKAKKNPKLKKKLQRFLDEKEDKIHRIYNDGREVKAEIMLTNMTKTEIDHAIRHEGALVSDDRLKSYY